jgi:hypothetical protein
MSMKCLQHETVAPERDQHIRILRRMIAMTGYQVGQRTLGVGGGTSEEGDAGRRGHRRLRSRDRTAG